MTRNLAASLRRWIDVALYGILGAVAISYLSPVLVKLINEKAIDLLGNSYVAQWVLAALGIGFLASVNRIAGIQLRHLQYLFSYPPLSIAVLVACGVAPLLPVLSGGILQAERFNWLMAGTVAGIFTSFWMIQVFCAVALHWLLEEPLNKKHEHAVTHSDIKQLSDANLQEWLRREDPIVGQESDLFGHGAIAEKLLERIERGETTVALQGDFGSGKSSLTAMCRQLAEEKHARLIFAKVSCWGVEDAARAQEEILSELVAEMAKDVDCTALRNIPSKYVDAISENSSWLKTFFSLGPRKSPLQQLQRLSPLLAAIRKQAVIVIEDVDRNASSFDLSKIQALLVQFREVKGLTFVLAISPEQQIDFARLCEFVEIIPPLQAHRSLQIVNHLRELVMREFPVSVLLDSIETLPLSEWDHTGPHTYLGYHWPWPLALADLLNAPRQLKHALRRVADVWPRLCGEVRIDDLICISALRIAAPEAFAFFTINQHLFRSAGTSDDPNSRDEARVAFRDALREQWRKLAEGNRFNSRAAAYIMKELDPYSDAITGSGTRPYTNHRQSMQSKTRGRIYARRLFTESLDPGDLGDQFILGHLVLAKTDPHSRRILAETICDSQGAAVTFEEFSSPLQFTKQDALNLLTEIHCVIRARHGAKIDRELHAGFFAAWRFVGRFDRPVNFEVWLVGEVVKCVPEHLHLLNEIYYFWLGTDQHGFDERKAPRSAVYTLLKSRWPELPPIKFSEGFDPDFPYVLFHLIFTSDYQTPDAVPYGKAEDWSWIGPILLAAMDEAPEVLLPQILFAVNLNWSDGQLPRFKFDHAVLDSWFGSRKNELLRRVAKGFHIRETLTAQARYLLEAAISEAEQVEGNLE